MGNSKKLCFAICDGSPPAFCRGIIVWEWLCVLRGIINPQEHTPIVRYHAARHHQEPLGER